MTNKNDHAASPARGRWWWIIVAVVVALVATGAGGFVLGQLLTPSIAAPTDAAAPTTAPADVDDDGRMYTCSMHPQVRSSDPDAKCPICAMDLIPVPDDDEAEADDASLPRLRLTQRAAALMQVRVEPAERRPVEIPVPLYGQLDYDETRVRDVNTKVSGWIEKLHVDFVGAAVQPGDALFDLYSPELYTAQEEYLIALRRRDAAGASNEGGLLESARTRLLYSDVTAAQIEALTQRGAPNQVLSIRSPHEGVVIERNAYEGMRVEPGTRLYRIADLSRLWVQLEVYEADLPWLAPGQRAVVKTQAHPGVEFEGRVAFIDPVIDERTRTARARVQVDNADGLLKPGMFVRGEVHGSLDAPEQDQAPLLIPHSAPLITGRRAVVYVQLPDRDRPTYEARDVVLGPRAGAWYVVREGLEAGDLVVTHGAFKIDSELQIRGRPSMMQPDGGESPVHDHGEHDAGLQPDDILRRPATEEEIAAYPLDTCVVSGLALDSMGGPIRIEHDGRTVLLCCESCLSDFSQSPQRYLDQLAEAEDSGGQRQ